jgi:hypothetical protein
LELPWPHLAARQVIHFPLFANPIIPLRATHSRMSFCRRHLSAPIPRNSTLGNRDRIWCEISEHDGSTGESVN